MLLIVLHFLIISKSIQMGFYWIKTNSIIKKLFSRYVWDLPNTENKVYLTFDDGPTPEVTEWVLEELEKHHAKATFFCIGKNIAAHPAIYKAILKKGHRVGNHTFNHWNGWKAKTEDYLKNIALCENLIAPTSVETKIFRPPYGKIKPAQAKRLRKLGYKIIMWDVLSADFDQTITKERCLKNVLSNITSGSIIVFHDSNKAFKNLEYTLPKVLEHIDNNHFSCAVLP